MLGKLYGIGVGVGDVEQLTLKAVKVLKELDIVVVPEAKKDEGSTAYDIIKDFLKKGAEVITLEFVMSKNLDERIESRKNNTCIIEKLLREGKNVGFLTIGDCMTYSTYVYVLENLAEDLLKNVESVSGISTFADISSRFNFPLVVGDESLKIISLNRKTDIEKELSENDNLVIMKISRDFQKLKEIIIKNNLQGNIIIVSNSGKNTEKFYYGIDEIEEIPYFSTLIYKKEGFSKWKKYIL